MKDKKPMQEELLNSVAGGVELRIPMDDNNMDPRRTEEVEKRWKIIVQRREWHFKDEEEELKAKQMWLEQSMNLSGPMPNLNQLFKGGVL